MKVLLILNIVISLQVIEVYTAYTALKNKINGKRDITLSLSSTDAEIDPRSHSKTISFIKTINDDYVKGEFTVENLSPEIQKELKNEDVNKKFEKFYIFNPLPSVPDDIDDLFDFVNKQDGLSPNEVSNRGNESLEDDHESVEREDIESKSPHNHSKLTFKYGNSKEAPVEEVIGSNNRDSKIYGDAEVIDSESTLLKLRSQSLADNLTEQKQTHLDVSNVSESPFNKYILNESSERLQLTTGSPPYVSPTLKKQASSSKNIRTSSNKVLGRYNEAIKYILLIRKHSE